MSDTSYRNVNVLYAGLCGSDLQKFGSTDITKLGHEVTARTDDGKCVAIRPLWGCGHCPACADENIALCPKLSALGRTTNGGFSGSITVPDACMYDIPESLKITAVLADPYAVILHAFAQVQTPLDRIAILGDGVLAQLALIHVYTSIQTRSCTIFAKNNSRAAELLATYKPLFETAGIILTTQTSDAPKSSDYNVVMDVVGRAQSDTLNLAINLIASRGQIINVGVYPEGYQLPVNIRSLLYKEAHLVGSNSFQTSDFSKALQRIIDSPVAFENILGNLYSADALQSSFEDAISRDQQTVPKKSVICYE